MTTVIENSALVVVRLLARLATIASVGLLIPFLFSGPRFPDGKDAFALAFFPIGVMAGMSWAWRNEVAGGVMTVASLAIFYGIMFAQRGSMPGGPYFFLFALPGIVLLACGLVARRATAG